MYLTPALLADIGDRADERQYQIAMTEADLMDLASGCVPRIVQAMAGTLLEWEDQVRRQAQRPAKPKKAVRRKYAEG